MKVELAGWGGYPRRDCRVETPRDEDTLRGLVGAGGVVARGSGRAYGDSAIGTVTTIDMRRMNRMLSFDESSGRLVAEAGVILGDVIKAFLPRGWFPYVTPGTKFVTIGGAIAADVHGKNHHKEGSFGTFVDWIDIMGADGSVTRASRIEHANLFEFTLGGMGLTGLILRAAIRLKPVESAWIHEKAVLAPNLFEALAAFEAADDSTYSVAWIDCLARGDAVGRSIITTGEHAAAGLLPPDRRERPLQSPERVKWRMRFDAPAAALNSYTVRAFNAAYWLRGRFARGERLVDWDSFFYPLDAVLGWNRIYGRRGFVQFQCVLPLEASASGLTALLNATATAGQGSFLAVLKRLGEQKSPFSFPMAGYTLALDFPVNRETLHLLDRLDAITIDHGGRFYLAKDARLAAATLRRADPRAENFREMRRAAGLDVSFCSAQAERLKI
ncbi:FAD-binding oxidoreductase [Rhizobium sp. KVB221]|uniref:FAD-binding oxidoreductase n=1 Tax=Rhizobium setariae TaxID=2801340 RepID=A0A937CNF9_9HYPH|nr:FAD-binding oxidoreductase [Rhizobium setariae]MBL0373701.1 FAD-binding oxidoreductase [Rhizobium setariae]